MKILGLDVGTKRVGLAAADTETLIALSRGYIEGNHKELERQLIEMIRDEAIERVVVGMPYHEDGSKSKQCLHIENFCRRIEQRANVSFVFVDEYGTSQQAIEMIDQAGSAAKLHRQKGVVDAGAASIILQSYLDTMKKST